MIYDTVSNLELNIKFLLDLTLLCDGWYRNITQGQTIRGIDASKMIIIPEAVSDYGGVSGTQVWQSPFQQWIYESGVVLNPSPYISGKVPPTVCSGIYVNNTFFSNAISGQSFYLDFINGRVLFDGTGIPANSLVQATFSYRLCRTDYSDGAQAQELIEAYNETYLKDNPLGGPDSIIYPSGDMRAHTFPCIYISTPSLIPHPLEIGNRSINEEVEAHLAICATSRWERNSIYELLKDKIYLTAPLIDFNYAPIPLSGITNSLSPEYIPYQTLATNPVFKGNKVISWTWYIQDGYGQKYENANALGVYRPQLIPFLGGTIVYTCIITNIAPQGRIEANPFWK